MASKSAPKKGSQTKISTTQLVPKSRPKPSPLTLEDFRSAFEKVQSLGLTWTADIPPRLITAKPETEAMLTNPEVARLQQMYPEFPMELGAAIFLILTGRSLSTVTGNKKLTEQKVSIVRRAGIITGKYKRDFFFKHTTKVPYLSGLDWEVVLKVHEKDVKVPPRISYALLSLEFEGPGQRSGSKTRSVVAVNEEMTDKLIESLSEVRLALQESIGARYISRKDSKEKDHAAGNSSRFLEQPRST